MQREQQVDFKQGYISGNVYTYMCMCRFVFLSVCLSFIFYLFTFANVSTMVSIQVFHTAQFQKSALFWACQRLD